MSKQNRRNLSNRNIIFICIALAVLLVAINVVIFALNRNKDKETAEPETVETVEQAASDDIVSETIANISTDNVDAGTSNAPSDSTSDSTSEKTDEKEDSTEADKESDSEDAWQTLIFRDAFGVEYETTINPDVAPKKYPDSAFSKNGDKMSYLDGDYMLGIDVSHHQGNIDWNAVKSAGYDFAILRIGYRGYGGEGTLNADKLFEQYYNDAKAAGLQVGVYFFAQAINEDEAREEAEFVLNILGGRELDLPVVYDPESILDDVARTDDVTGEQFTANSRVFCETVAAAGYDPMIYANMKWEAFELDLTKLAEFPIWYADYEDKPQTPYDFVIWQYSNEGSVPGVAGACDQDIWIR